MPGAARGLRQSRVWRRAAEMLGVAVLTMDADGEVAHAGHDARETAGLDLGVVLAERAVTDVVQKNSIFPGPRIQSACWAPVTAPGGRLVIR